jgi:hypothetical protein
MRSLALKSASNEDPRMSIHETPANEGSKDPEITCHRALLASVAEFIHCDQGPSNIHLINTHLFHLVYVLDMESPSFTSMVMHVSWAGQPMVYKPNGEFSPTLLQCRQILQDTSAKLLRHYFLTNSDPYKYDPGGVLAVHLETGVSSEVKVAQLVTLAL